MTDNIYCNFNFDEISVKIFSAFLGASSLNEYIGEVAGIIQNPVIVLDNMFRVLAASPISGVDDPAWCQAVECEYYREELVLGVMECGSVMTEEDSRAQREAAPNTYKRLVGRLNYKGKPYGSLVVLCLNDVEPRLMELMPLICDLTVKISGLGRQDSAFNEPLIYENVFIDLINDKIHTHSALQIRTGSVGLDREYKYFQLHTIPIHPGSTVSPGGLKRAIDRLLVRSWMVFYNNQLLILSMSRERMRHSDFPVQQIETLLRPHHLIMCSSEVFTELLHLSYHYQKNRSAIILAEWVKESACVFCYDKYMFFDMAMTAANGDESALADYVSEDVKNIRDYDQEYGTDYLRTVFTFLSCNKSYIQTAQKLFTHKNTIAYRISRLKELFGLDLEDMENAFRIYYSCKLIQYMEAISANRVIK